MTKNIPVGIKATAFKTFETFSKKINIEIWSCFGTEIEENSHLRD